MNVRAFNHENKKKTPQKKAAILLADGLLPVPSNLMTSQKAIIVPMDGHANQWIIL